MFSGSLKLWGVSLIGFYLLGSRATKCATLFSESGCATPANEIARR
jgi:hypothetical protein